MQFSQWLKQELDAREMRVRAFAEAAGVSRQLVYEWIRGTITPDTDSCDKIATALLLDPDIVLAAAGRRKRGPAVESDPVEARIIAAYRAVPPAEKPHASRAAVGAMRAFTNPNARKSGHRGARPAGLAHAA